MEKRKPNDLSPEQRLAVDTESLCKLLDCGRHTAVQIGDHAHARITMNSRVLWSSSIKDEPFANTPLPNIRKSDILTFYTKLLKKGFAINSLESINNLVHPAPELAVDDD